MPAQEMDGTQILGSAVDHVALVRRMECVSNPALSSPFPMAQLINNAGILPLSKVNIGMPRRKGNYQRRKAQLVVRRSHFGQRYRLPLASLDQTRVGIADSASA